MGREGEQNNERLPVFKRLSPEKKKGEIKFKKEMRYAPT